MRPIGSISHRLLLSKYLYIRGTDILRAGGIFDPGLAVSLFQDAVEISLVACAAQFHATYPEAASFFRIWEATDVALERHQRASLSMKADMLALNKTRVSFKHYGERIDRAASETHRINTGNFLSITARSYFDIDFNKLTLVTFVQENKEREALEGATSALAIGERKDSLIKCAEALELMRVRNAQFFEHGLLVSFPNIDATAKSYVDHQIAHLRKHIYDVEGLVHSTLYGVPPMDFMLLRQILPTIRGTEITFEHWGHALIEDSTVERGIEILAQYSIGMTDRHAAVRNLLPNSDVFF